MFHYLAQLLSQFPIGPSRRGIGTAKIKVNPTQLSEQMPLPVQSDHPTFLDNTAGLPMPPQDSRMPQQMVHGTSVKVKIPKPSIVHRRSLWG